MRHCPAFIISRSASCRALRGGARADRPPAGRPHDGSAAAQRRAGGRRPGQSGPCRTPPASPAAGSTAEAAEGPGPDAPKPLFTDDFLDRFYDRLQNYKKEYQCRSASAPGTGNTSTAAARTGRATASRRTRQGPILVHRRRPRRKLDDGGPISKVGGHVEVRVGQQGEFRPDHTSDVWTYEDYLFADTKAGRFKAGRSWSGSGWRAGRRFVLGDDPVFRRL